MEGMLNYFVPEDGDSSDHLNVVPLPRVDQLRLQHVKKCFPLPGEFHFRFKTAFEGTYVWMDLVDDNDVVPDYNGLVISKISRVQQESITRPVERAESPAPQPAETLDLMETAEPPASPTKREEPKTTQKTFNDDLVGLLSDPVPTTPQEAPAAPATPPQVNAPPQDPFDLFTGSSTAPMRPSPVSAAMNSSTGMNSSSGMNSSGMSSSGGPRGPSATTPGGHAGGYGGTQAYNPMGSGGPSAMGPRPAGNMNISQMHMGMGPPPSGHQQQQQQNSFQGLQWQGMGNQQRSQNPNQNARQW